MPAEGRNTPVACTVCHKVISRKADLPRHMRTHDEHKEALMHACPFPNCDHKTLQKSNMLTHIRTHTRECSKTCPHPGCAYATTDPGSLTRHRKVLHGYEPKARCSPGGKAARRSAAAPYPSTRFMKPEAEIPASLDLDDPAFPELAGLVRCDALSPAESSRSGVPQFSGELDELPWERLFPDLPAESFTSVYDQPSQLPISNYHQPPTVPADLSTLHMPQFDPELFSNVNYQQPVPDVNFQSQPVSGSDLNNSFPAELDEFLQKYGSGFFEGRCEYPDSATYSMAPPSFTN
ncbi:hypothetical protein DEU56DRAFT_66826 [Suillus clintonianus]|uniref:uncharacterized protein n=1 Tax=Suillus clintonianus TaxID=1904413 RepID=UPI001B884619|nr:uncharacterized protein DEU56DRAFT_66826 [Suillus clintonianus]KAG2123097.1 hypothetical protein DEU56DRAFT_66826 [Suillus clintonianus]